MSVTTDTDNAAPSRLNGAQLHGRAKNAPMHLPGWINARFELWVKVEELVDLIVDPILEHSCWDVLNNDELAEQLKTCPAVEEKAILTAHVYDLVAAGDFIELERIAQAIDDAETEDFGEDEEEEDEDKDDSH